MRSSQPQVLAMVGGGVLILSGTGLLLFGPGPLLTAEVAKVLDVGFVVAGGMLFATRWR
jgi:hypothetical protein